MTDRDRYKAVLDAIDLLQHRLLEANLGDIDRIEFKDRRAPDAMIWHLEMREITMAYAAPAMPDCRLKWHGIKLA